LGNRRFFIFSILLITIVLVSFPLLSYVAKNRIIHFFEFNEGGGFSQRHFLWKTGLDMFTERPILGQGLGTFMFNFERFKPKDYPAGWEISYAHNCFLQIASETGILGFLSFITMITILFFVSIKILIGIKKNVLYYHILSGLLIGIFAYLVGSTFDTNLYSLPLAVLFWFMVGLVVGVIKIIHLESRQ
jgi:O-antigen ligase